METAYSKILRQIALEINSIIDENIRFVESGTDADRYAIMEGMQTVQAAIKSALIEKIVADEFQATTLAEEIAHGKRIGGMRDIVQQLTNKHRKTVNAMSLDELEQIMTEHGYEWDSSRNEWRHESWHMDAE